MDKQEENTEIKMEQPLKIPFYKKLRNAITKIETYPEMAAEGLNKAFHYIAKLICIVAIIISIAIMVQAYQLLSSGVAYLENEAPEFSYQDGILTVESDTKIQIPEENSILGETIIDTNVTEENAINQYVQEVSNNGRGIVILNNRAILKNESLSGTITYNYSEMFTELKIESFNKQDVITFLTTSKVISLYVAIFIVMFIYTFVMYLIAALFNSLLLSLFGHIVTMFLRMRLKPKALYNMSIYAITLSVLLEMIYIVVNMFISFTISYFLVMYISVATIYLIAALFMLKGEMIKRQEELTKLVEVQQTVRKEMQEQKEQEEEKVGKEENKEVEKETEDTEKETKQNEAEKNDDNNIEAPGSSEA